MTRVFASLRVLDLDRRSRRFVHIAAEGQELLDIQGKPYGAGLGFRLICMASGCIPFIKQDMEIGLPGDLRPQRFEGGELGIELNAVPWLGDVQR